MKQFQWPEAARSSQCDPCGIKSLLQDCGCVPQFGARSVSQGVEERAGPLCRNPVRTVTPIEKKDLLGSFGKIQQTRKSEAARLNRAAPLESSLMAGSIGRRARPTCQRSSLRC